MLLASASGDGASVELRVVRYQYPGVAASGTRDWDANWLVVRGDAHTAQGEAWSFSDPCLTTWEARELTVWLREATDGRVAPTEAPADSGELFVFTEPNIALSVAAREGESVVIRVHLSLEGAPPSLADSDPDIWDFFVPITMSPDSLRAAAASWEDDLAAYPVR
jgi:hypothetical protein